MTGGPGGTGRRFQLLELVGRGSYGDVYLAEQHSGAGFRKKVALKLLNEDVARMRSAAGRMRDEARILGLLSHRHIVAVHDLVRVDPLVPGLEAGSRWAILMDWVPGADLEHLIEALQVVGATVPVTVALEIGAAICEALDFAANATDGMGAPLGVIHRDIKPGNVRLTVDGEVKVLDFGGARSSLQGREAATRSGAWIGTERYMAPERLLRGGDTGAGDIYAVGATVVELILGRPLGRTPLEPVQHQALVDDALAAVRPLVEVEPAVVDRLVALLGSTLSHDPAGRPAPKDLGVELRALARVVTGPPIHQFAQEFVSRVDELLGRAPLPGSGTLQEVGSEVDPADRVEGATFVDEPPAPTWRRILPILVLTAIAASVLGAFSVGVGAATMQALSSQSASAETVIPPPPPPPPPPPSPAPKAQVVFTAFPEEGPRAPVPAPRSVRHREVPRPPSPEPVPVLRVDRTVVAVKDASRLVVACGDVAASGTASVRIMDFPAGRCTVEADWLDGSYTTQLTIEQPGTYQCRVQDGTLQCS